MKQKPKQAAGLLAVCLILTALLPLTGCTKAGGRPLFWYAEQSFPFEMSLSTPALSFSLTGERTPTAVILTVLSPENLAGLTVTYKDGNCVLASGETAIPLSEKAAEGLTVLLDGLLLSSAEGAKLGSDEKGRTTVASHSLTLTLDENGLPAAIRHEETGREAQILVPANAFDNKDSPHTTE